MEILHALLGIAGASVAFIAMLFLLMDELGGNGIQLSRRERCVFGGLVIVFGGLSFILIS